MDNRMYEEYVVYTVEYIVGVGLKTEPVYYILGIYKTEEAANEKKKREEEEAYRLGYTHLRFCVEEIPVFDSKFKKKKEQKKSCREMQETKRRWW